MRLVFFKNIYTGNATDVIAINPDYVISVYEQDLDDVDSSKKKKKTRATMIYTVQGLCYAVADKFINVVERLQDEPSLYDRP